MTAPPLPKVLHVAAELTPDIAAFLVPALRELSQAGVRQTLVHADADPAPIPGDVRPVRLELPPRSGTLAFARALRAALHVELVSRRYQAIHLHGAVAAFAGRLALQGIDEPPPVFQSPHGQSGLAQRGRFGTALAGTYARLAGAESPELPTPVDARLFELERRPEDPPRVVALGFAAEPQAPERFAELAARFHFAGHPAVFVWAGGGEAHFEQVLRAAEVEFTGDADPEAAFAQLERASLAIVMARGEGAPFLVAQAMAAGVPCLASDVPAHREVLGSCSGGALMDDLDTFALEARALLEQPERSARIGAAARREAQRRFAPERLAHALLDLYRLPPAPAVAAPAPVFDAAAR